MKIFYSFLGGFALALLIFIANEFTRFLPFFPQKTVVNIETNQGNYLAPLFPIDKLSIGVTNKVTLTNILLLSIDDSQYRADPFIFHQTNSILYVQHYERFGQYEIKQWDNKLNLYSAYYGVFSGAFGIMYQRKVVNNLFDSDILVGGFADTKKNAGLLLSVSR